MSTDRQRLLEALQDLAGNPATPDEFVGAYERVVVNLYEHSLFVQEESLRSLYYNMLVNYFLGNTAKANSLRIRVSMRARNLWEELSG